MNKKATAKIYLSESCPSDDVRPAKDRSPHPTDSWLKRELQSLYVDLESMPLPASLAELAAELERKLQAAKNKQKDQSQTGFQVSGDAKK